MNIPKLKKPDYKVISSAAMENQGNSLTLLSLGKNRTMKSISKDEVVATGTINTTSIECKAFENYETGVSEIYVIISEINHSGNISMTLDIELVSPSITISEEDCYNIYSLYYGENFETSTTPDNFCSTTVITAAIKSDETYGNYIEADNNKDNNSTFFSIVDLKAPSEGNYILEFDASLASSSSPKTSSTFFILTEKDDRNSYLLKLYSNDQNYGNNQLSWRINDSDSYVSLPQEFLHFKLYIERSTNTVGLSIYKSNGEAILEKEIINKGSTATSDSVKQFYMILGKHYRALIKLNNISLYSYDQMKITPEFKQNQLKISLDTYLISIINVVNKSLYCNVSFEDTEVSIESIEEGTTYMYFDGILNESNNKALVLLIIKIDERGLVSCDDLYIFSIDPNFDKIPSTIQKEYHTTSSIEGLDNNEPEDNPNIIPYVDTDEINNKFSQFDPEKLVKPRIKIGFCITNNNWCILYTKDNEITEYSEYVLYEKSYEGLFDAINASFNFLTSGRTTKEKISIITSGSTNTASKNTSSTVNSNNRMANSVAISCKSLVILDFENNYFYIDNSEDYVTSSNKYNIKCFIDMERGVNNTTICNLILMGSCTYGIFVAQGREILFQNIKMTIAKRDKMCVSIGIRAQSQENAIANVNLSRWSRYLYFDNCEFNGLTEHGIETFNVYNIYASTIKITDVGGCGVLLNCSYNAWINRVIAIRCCASDTYAAVRFANDAGPNINIHYVYGEATGNGVFLVSSSNDIHIDKINLVNIHATPIYVGGSAGLHVQSGQIISNGGVITYYNFKGEIGNSEATTGGGIFIVGGSSSQFLPQWNNVFKNIKIDGFKIGYSERYKMSSNYNIYYNLDTTGCQKVKEPSSSGTGTLQDVPFGFCVIDNQKGPGNEIITGDKIISGDYTYALNSDSTSYILMEYSGLDSVLSIPKKFKGKPISRIGSFAFYGNKKLISVTINSNITSLGGLSFGNCVSLKYLKFMSGGEYEIGHCAFRGCEKLSDVDLTDVKILRASCFAWCKSLTKLICPKSVVYFGANVFYNDNIDLTIQCDDISLMTVEPYAFYFIGINSTINFPGIEAPTDLVGVKATGDNSYYYNSQSYVEEKLYKPGIWCKYYYHVVVTPTFKS